MMGTFSFWHWIVLFAVIAGIWGLVRVVLRSGASRWWILPLLVPGIGGFALLWFSYARWPAADARSSTKI
jgi:hypothetical protein